MGNIIPTSGKDKKVLPADVFNAADTDKDGKLCRGARQDVDEGWIGPSKRTDGNVGACV